MMRVRKLLADNIIFRAKHKYDLEIYKAELLLEIYREKYPKDLAIYQNKLDELLDKKSKAIQIAELEAKQYVEETHG